MYPVARVVVAVLMVLLIASRAAGEELALPTPASRANETLAAMARVDPLRLLRLLAETPINSRDLPGRVDAFDPSLVEATPPPASSIGPMLGRVVIGFGRYRHPGDASTSTRESLAELMYLDVYPDESAARAAVEPVAAGGTPAPVVPGGGVLGSVAGYPSYELEDRGPGGGGVFSVQVRVGYVVISAGAFYRPAQQDEPAAEFARSMAAAGVAHLEQVLLE